MNTRSILLAGALALGCAPAVQQPTPNIDPGRTEAPVVALPADSAAAAVPVAPADAAYARGWMPLAATGVTNFLALHPEWDGRGVLIGILDSGIDAGVPGLQRTPNGSPKILDLRDFGHEGAVPLTRVDPAGDSVRIGGVSLGGMSRVRTLNAAGPWYGGLLHERPLGEMPAADVNGDGDDADSLAVLVTQASDGWVVLVDSDGDGSLAGERPVRDYLHGRDTFGWAEPGKPSPLTVAVNIAVAGGVPSLDLFFDTSGHGTHVAGIAAGNDMYGVGGFDGVAPGAQLLGLKIANNAHGGVTVTGSMLRAMDYAIRFAKSRNLPLVLNMSFGVGNEVEGTARMDEIVDSVLAANPDVAMAISAGNDGPGLSTLGFPGSADRAVTVGATFPLAFLAGDPEDGRPDPVAYFSSRGGELAKPDIVTPGVAYSTVPRFNTGDERKGGTSMATVDIGRLLLLARRRARQARYRHPRRGLFDRPAVQHRRRAEGRHQHGLAPRRRAPRIAALGGRGGEEAGKRAPAEAGLDGDGPPARQRHLCRPGDRHPERRVGLDLVERAPRGAGGSHPIRRGGRRERGVPPNGPVV